MPTVVQTKSNSHKGISTDTLTNNFQLTSERTPRKISEPWRNIAEETIRIFFVYAKMTSPLTILTLLRNRIIFLWRSSREGQEKVRRERLFGWEKDAEHQRRCQKTQNKTARTTLPPKVLATKVLVGVVGVGAVAERNKPHSLVKLSKQTP